MVAPRVTASTMLDLLGTDPPTVELAWSDDDGVPVRMTVLFRSNNINQFLGFRGSPAEVRQALTRGLAAIDRAAAERATEGA